MEDDYALVRRARKESVALLRKLSSPKGFLASLEETANYRRVWCRDGVIAGLAALASGEGALIEAFRRTLLTLRDHQNETGQIPNNVVCEEGICRPDYGESVGTIDATIWYVLGVCRFSLETGERSFFQGMLPSVRKALFYLRCLELNDRGLLYIPQSADWSDEYINHGYVLSDQVLYHLALSGVCSLSGDADMCAKRDRLADLIRINYFPQKKNERDPLVYNPLLFRDGVKQYAPPFPAAYFSNHSIRFHTDNLANSLLLSSGILGEKHMRALRREIVRRFVRSEFPVIPAFDPVISEGDASWEHLRKNYRFFFKNEPYRFHNGGLWPMVHGLFLSSFAGEKEGEKHILAFARALARDDYSFPEYYHGQTFAAEGTRHLAFSAAGYLFAHAAIVEGKKIFECS